ncbi:MAG: ATP-binding protein [Streptosporangiales bacterium]|jgi:anti-sigma regulatory factor (Ser/Thr protein kinase)|nr:ATP-binding protein [Streptosporangiales bacterium]
MKQCRIELVASPTAPVEARQQVRAVISVWGVPVETETAELLVSELVTNAYRHDAGEWITLAIQRRHGVLRVDVHDSASGRPEAAAGAGVPEARESPEDRDEFDDIPGEGESGRGLLIVETLADEWGFYRTEIGKAVFFALHYSE